MNTLYLLPIIGAAIGWLTNYVAVKMLFHPRKPIRLLFLFPVQGVFPKRQNDLAKKLGEIVSTELFSADDVQAHLRQHASSDEVQGMIREKIEKIIITRLPEIMPMAAMFLTPELVGMVSNALAGEMKDTVQEFVDDLSGKIKEEMDVHQIVEDKVANFSSDKLEEILFAIMKKEFRFIELIGAVLGFLIGCAQVALVNYSL